MYESWVRWKGGEASVDLKCLSEAPSAVAYRVLRWVIAKINEGSLSGRISQPQPTDFFHIERLYRWSLEGQSGQGLSLPQNLEARKEFSHLIIEKRGQTGKGSSSAGSSNYSYTVEVPSTVKIAEIGLAFRFEYIRLEEGQPRYNSRGSILLDAKLAESPLLLRNWQPGDAYRPAGHRSPKKLQDLFQRERVPVRERAGWPVLLAGERIVWARGLSVATGCSPPPESHQAVELHEIR
jgi:tRNA(Ile)-lysidine synthetase-like protein